MAETPFDTLGMMRQLEAKGFSSEQAEGVTQAVQTGVTGGVASKADLAEFRAEVRTGMNWMKVIGGAQFVVLLLLAGWVLTFFAPMNGTTP